MKESAHKRVYIPVQTWINLLRGIIKLKNAFHNLNYHKDWIVQEAHREVKINQWKRIDSKRKSIRIFL